jgi:hypothetical protein
MIRRQKMTYLILGMALVLAWQLGGEVLVDRAEADSHIGGYQYLVLGEGAPGLGTPEEGIALLENLVLPTLDQLGANDAVLAGGLPVGERALAFIIEAESNAAADEIIRQLPMWSLITWEVTPLQSFGARAAIERGTVEHLKKMLER